MNRTTGSSATNLVPSRVYPIVRIEMKLLIKTLKANLLRTLLSQLSMGVFMMSTCSQAKDSPVEIRARGTKEGSCQRSVALNQSSGWHKNEA